MRNIVALLFLGFGAKALAQETYTGSDKSSMNIDGAPMLHDLTLLEKLVDTYFNIVRYEKN